jgi:hypothetical protein
MRKLFLVSSALFLLSLFVFPTPSYASFVATDKAMNGKIQIDPNNKPVARQSLLLRFELSDPESKFQLKDCTCTLTITQPGRLPYSQPLTVQNVNAPSNIVTIDYIFPTPATYTITLTGSPSGKTAFTPFTLTWKIPVTGTPIQVPTKTKSNALYIIFGSLFVVFILIAGSLYLKFRTQKKINA